MQRSTHPFLPPREGLYDPAYERDACGIGFVASLRREATHEVVERALQVLVNLLHRGAAGCDPETGDGAGILIQIPHAFFAEEADRLGWELPQPGQYGVGMVFLPTQSTARSICKQMLGHIIDEEGLHVLGWRVVPVNPEVLGRLARTNRPHIEQIFVAPKQPMDQDALERRLYVVLKRAEHEISAAGFEGHEAFYIPSFSSRTIVYKGLLHAHQIKRFYLDLADSRVTSKLAMVHQRFSTNTFPTWPLAHPFRILCHNGEINTLRGNINWMRAREALLQSPLFGEDLKKILPVIREGLSDSATLDSVVHLLYLAGRSLPHVMAMVIPEAWEQAPWMSETKRAFYEYHAALMEPWDGPAAIAFTDGRLIGATLDRNGLRPARYLVTEDGYVVVGSETGVFDVEPENIRYRGRLQPGRMLLVDVEAGRIVPDEEIKEELARRRPYRQWIERHQVRLEQLPAPRQLQQVEPGRLRCLQLVFGYTEEECSRILNPMATQAEDPVGSMGYDTPLACLSDQPQLLFNYFRQLFAQVTNPAIDPIREELVMSLTNFVGAAKNLLDETPEHCHLLKLPHPILTDWDLERIRAISHGDLRAITLTTLFPAKGGAAALEAALEELCRRAESAVESGYTILILSDRGVDSRNAPIPSLLAVSAVHHHLIRAGLRMHTGLVVESGEPREVHHFCLLIGYGANAVNPYLAFATLEDMARRGELGMDISPEKAQANYIKAVKKGLLKVMSKMGISTLQSYHGAQVFEAIGLSRELVDKYFAGTASRLGGVDLEVLAREARMKHEQAFREPVNGHSQLPIGGYLAYREGGEQHLLNPFTISKLQHAVRQNLPEAYWEYARAINEQNEKLYTLRGLLRFKTLERPIPLEEVEPATSIVRRFCTGAMSFGSISKEAHETLAIAMNRIGAKSNTGEGGEDEERFGDERRSAIKQVASGRFGVTINYLVNADELQIKIAQGAKPGEGGQLPGHKVDEVIARLRHSIPGVGLISPPPHHDIYSIEDLAQLIFDLKNANPKARVSVKLVSAVGVGIVAAGVAKAGADVVLISGDSGGTGASPITSIRHAGIPWELGLAETQQVLIKNGLRDRIIVQVDGKLLTGRDVAIAALLGAEEFGFSTGALISLGCVMMRKCHLNTCPVGIATQDPRLRKKFAGQPEHLINYLFFVAEELRHYMAQMGFRTVEEMVGRVDMLEVKDLRRHWKARSLDFSWLLHEPQEVQTSGRRCTVGQRPMVDGVLDHRLIELCRDALEQQVPVELSLPIRNVDRAVGTMLSGEIARRYGSRGLPEDTIRIHFTGSAGQSFGAFLAPGVTLILEGDANDYIGKGLSGGKLIVRPPRNSRFAPEENVLIGNVALYGATSGEAYFNGVAGERFCVRNSGAIAVVEGVGDHGCEYMTKGLVVVLGRTGRNFAAGMSGGIAFVLDESGEFRSMYCNRAMVDLEPVRSPYDIAALRKLIERHWQYTGSRRARVVLDHWDEMLPRFVKIFPHDYKRVLGVPRLEEQDAELPALPEKTPLEVLRIIHG